MTTYRRATADEISALQEQSGAPHVWFKCECGTETMWHAKNIALSSRGGYNGTRNIFPTGRECDCAPSRLYCVVAE